MRTFLVKLYLLTGTTITMHVFAANQTEALFLAKDLMPSAKFVTVKPA